MVSNISSPSGAARPATETERSRAGQRVAAPPAAAAAPLDQLQLSEQAGTLPAGLLSGPPIDTAMVARLGEAVAAGRYPIDPDRIVEALMRDHADFHG
jgi:negative regulator of flagellin synthesis FlgM